jgi:hypothetical protein
VIDVQHLVTDIKTAVKQMNQARVEAGCSELIALIQKQPDALPAAEAFKILKLLRRKRMFSELERAAAAYLEQAESPLIQTLLAQSLIDQGRLKAGLDVAEKALAASPANSKPAEEARGLLGRVYKQAFVQPHRLLPQGAEALKAAIGAYRTAFELAADDPVWPGVNLLALLVRAEREEVDSGVAVTPKELASQLRALVAEQESAEAARAAERGREPDEQPWLLASSIEVSLARDDLDGAVRYAKAYLACLTADAFEFAGTARQLREIWQLDKHDVKKIAALSTLLEAEVLGKGGGFVSDPASRATHFDDGELEAIYGLERFRSYQWMREGLVAADAVARVERRDGYAMGTGFLVRGRSLRSDWNERQLFLTNRHVIGPTAASAVSPEHAIVRFTSHVGPDASEGVPVDKIEWSSDELDVTIVSLKRPVSRNFVLEADDQSGLEMTDPAARIYVIGHPGGQPLSYSMYDNEVVAYESPYLFYRSPTLGGSSGSPLLTAQWTVIGIHHHGSNSKYQANGGTLIRAIRP